MHYFEININVIEVIPSKYPLAKLEFEFDAKVNFIALKFLHTGCETEVMLKSFTL